MQCAPVPARLTESVARGPSSIAEEVLGPESRTHSLDVAVGFDWARRRASSRSSFNRNF